MGPSFDSRESLGALLALKHLMDVEPSAAPALRRVSGVQRALCDFRSGVNTTLPFAADNRRRKLAAEIEKVCFDSHRQLDWMVDRVDFSFMSGFPVGATFAAAECLDAYDEESIDGDAISEVPKGSLCCILAHGRRPGSKHLLLQWDGGLGWVSCRSEDGEKLLHQDWPCDEYLEELSEPLA